MTYVDAQFAPMRKTGQIKLHGAEAFEGMRKAGRLVATCLDMLTDHVKPGMYDAVMNYAFFRDPVNRFLGKGQGSAAEFDAT